MHSRKNGLIKQVGRMRVGNGERRWTTTTMDTEKERKKDWGENTAVGLGGTSTTTDN
jgi:hypothetical protein